MQPLDHLPAESARAARGLFFDIDDTVTTHGKLTAVAYNALWRAHDAGLTCVAITGRPAGWCDTSRACGRSTASSARTAAFTSA